jgi:hypothetical protein
MPKRSAADAHLAAVVPPPKVDGALKSRSGRTVKPKVGPSLRVRGRAARSCLQRIRRVSAAE